MKSPRRVLAGLLMLLVVGGSLFALNGSVPIPAGERSAFRAVDNAALNPLSPDDAPEAQVPASGPIVGRSAAPYAWHGDLRDVAHESNTDLPRLFMPVPGILWGADQPVVQTADPLAQTEQGPGLMPEPIMNFAGLDVNDGGGWHPPDTNGEVGPDYYIQTVNIALGIFDKDTGQAVVVLTYDEFFQGMPGSACDEDNRGDVVVNYDPIADRWIISDFAFPTNESRQCFAVSMTGDPVSGGWYFYDVDTLGPGGSWCDYPKIGVWPDGYYMSCNMFDPWSGAKVWALDRADMIAGLPVDTVTFDAGSAYGSLLPANVRGPLPPAGAPNYFASIEPPDTLYLWEFHVDWATPGNSTFTGPTALPVAPYTQPPWSDWVPQAGISQMLDSLGDRLMFSLQYRNMGDHESLWVNHTVQSNGVGGIRWYEVRDPDGTPVIYQQGTYQPDLNYRWMGSAAADQDGNMALGYSVSSADMYPAIRYAGRLDGETLGLLPQAEVSLIEGTGSQTGNDGRWGDYSMMTVDPVDDCTFWFTTEYLESTGGTWLTRIGSFKFPSCGQPKGWIDGAVYDAVTGDPLPGAPVVATGITMTFSAAADANGQVTLTLVPGTYTVTAGPLLPGYPNATATTVVVAAGVHTPVALYLEGVPALVADLTTVDDNVAGGNNNGYPEPGESGLLLYEEIVNTGATTATDVGAYLTALTPGVEVTTADTTYPDIGIGAGAVNNSPFVISIAPTVPCGARLDFSELLVTAQGNYTVTFSLYAKVRLPRVTLLVDDMENGQGAWVTGGTNNSWYLQTDVSHSPTHAWSDSPSSYLDNTNSWLRSPILDATDINGLELSFWHRYDTEATYDFGYVEYSINGGTTWLPYVAVYDGLQDTWTAQTLDGALMDGHEDIAFRFRFQSDGGVTADGWYIDDVDLSYEPYACYYLPPAVPTLIDPPDGTVSPLHAIDFSWEPGPLGGTVEGYDLELDGSALYTTTDPLLGLTLTAGLHTWRVRAYHSAGASDYTAPWTVEVQDPPAVPELLAPPDGTILTTTHDVTLTWQAGAGYPPDSYDLELDGVTHTVTATVFPTTLAAGDHTWRVRACNTAGCSDSTAAWSLSVIDAPGVPVLLAPPDATVTTTQTIDFTWQPSTTGGLPDGYDVEVDGTVYTATAANLSLTLDLGGHTWRVRGWNQAGASEYTAAWTLTIVEPAGVPELLAPADGTVTTTTALTFTWQAGAGAAPDGYNIELDGTVITTTEPLYAATLTAGAHTWRVRAFAAAGYTDYTAAWTLTVQEFYRVFLPLVTK